ncbi:MAG: cupin domain-containing protein [Armatimonadota bacterium]
MTFIDLNTLPVRDILPGCHMRALHSENMTVTHWQLDAGATIPGHSHPHEQITTLIEGEMELTVGDETKLMTPNISAVIPSGTRHSVKALTPCRVIDVFTPVREDYR